MLMNGGIYNGKRILSEEATGEILKCRFQTANYGVRYRVQIQDNVIDEKTVYVHTGSNFGMFAAFAFIPGEKNGVVVLTSGTDGAKNEKDEICRVCNDVIKNILA